MKESISNAMLFYVIITFVVILIMFFVGSLSYSKAYKVKNKIIEEIEKEAELPSNPIDTYEAATRAYDNAADNIEEWLASGAGNGTGIGYRPITGIASHRDNCRNDKGILVSGSSRYQYCVYQINTCDNGNGQNKERCGVYYKVTTFMFFDIPIIGDLLKIPVSGETITFTQIES